MSNRKTKLVIFDLDGVLTDTARYHYLAWKQLAQKIGYPLSEAQNEKLKGVNREASLRLILEWANYTAAEDEFKRMLEEKNEHYLTLISRMNESERFGSVTEVFSLLRAHGISIGLGSSSKNAAMVLERIGLEEAFDVQIDGRHTQRSKPDPEVFLLAASQIGVSPSQCVVVEDAKAGVQAAKAAGMFCIGIGHESELSEADVCIPDLSHFNMELLQ